MGKFHIYINRTNFKMTVKRGLRFLFISFLTLLIYFLLCKWIFPPFTLTQLSFLLFDSRSSNKAFAREYIPYDSISENIKLAVIAAEDFRFATHNGIDWIAVRKASEYNRSHKDTSRLGGSSISQQVAKNVFLWQGGGYLRKVPEAGLAIGVDLIWGKRRTLEVYLNIIEFGDGIFGVEAAARHYFNKKAKDLTLDESVRLTLCLPDPKLIRPTQADEKFLGRIMQVKNIVSYLETDSLVLDIVY